MIIYFGTSLFKPGKEQIPRGTAEIVIVTVLDNESMSEEYRQKVVENRKYYAEKQGMLACGPQGRLQRTGLTLHYRICRILSQC